MVEPGGIEPPTSSLRTRRSPETVASLPRRRSFNLNCKRSLRSSTELRQLTFFKAFVVAVVAPVWPLSRRPFSAFSEPTGSFSAVAGHSMTCSFGNGCEDPGRNGFFVRTQIATRNESVPHIHPSRRRGLSACVFQSCLMRAGRGGRGCTSAIGSDLEDIASKFSELECLVPRQRNLTSIYRVLT